MEALILGSRSVLQDKFFQKDQEEKYRRHQENMKTIYNVKNGQLKDWKREVQSVALTLRKSKTTAKMFRDKEEKSHLKEKNLSLLKKIWNLQPSVNTFHQDRYQFTSGSNWGLRKKNMDQIKQENKLIALKVTHQHVDPNDYKKKLKEEIKSYIELRDGIRKMKVSKPKNTKSLKKDSNGVKIDKSPNSKKGEDKNIIEKDPEENPEKDI